MVRARIDIPQAALADFCREHHIQKLSFFGSVLRDDFRPDSDVDVLVLFEPGHIPGWDIVRIQDELAALLGGRKVDLITEDSLNRRIRKRVLREAEVEYVHEG